MRLYSLVEDKRFEPLPDMDRLELATYIKKNCGAWLEEAGDFACSLYHGDKLYRGALSAGSARALDEVPAFLKNIRTNRKPLDTGKPRHDVFNAIIASVGGIANRSNSIFCTSNAPRAKVFGKVYAAYPVGKFNYTWSPEYSDWTSDLTFKEIVRLLDTGLTKETAAYHQLVDRLLKKALQTIDINLENARSYLAQLRVRDINDPDVKIEIDHITDIIVMLKDRRLEKKENPGKAFENEIEEMLNVQLYQDNYLSNPMIYNNEAVKKVVYVDTGLRDAIGSYHEIMIHADQVLLVRQNLNSIIRMQLDAR